MRQKSAESRWKAAEKYKPKTEEEQKKEAQGEAAGTDGKTDDKGVLSEIMDDMSESIDAQEGNLETTGQLSEAELQQTRNCRKNNRDISRLTCGHNKSRYFTDACLG